MKKLSFVLSLTTNENDYQMEQAAAAEKAALRLGVDVQILFADNDSSQQSQQILRVIQAAPDARPRGILFEPVGGTALPQIARAAVTANIAWAVLNRDADYLFELRKAAQVPVFAVTSDHEEIGRIQGRQIAALLPEGGSVLCIQGPSDNPAAKQRTAGMNETKPAEVQVKFMKAHWTEASAHHAVGSWLRLSASRKIAIDVIAAHNDAMAAGAKRAFAELPDDDARKRWLNLPYLGVDGLPATGREWVKQGQLTATVVVPANGGHALEMMVKAIEDGFEVPERTLMTPESFPLAEENGGEMIRALSAGRA